MQIFKGKRSLFTMAGLILLIWFMQTMGGCQADRDPEMALINMATEVNNHAPRLIDSARRLDYMNVPEKRTVQYNYTLVKQEVSGIDTAAFKRKMKHEMVTGIETDPSMKFFKKSRIRFEIRYVDRNNESVCFFVIGPGDYLAGD